MPLCSRCMEEFRPYIGFVPEETTTAQIVRGDQSRNVGCDEEKNYGAQNCRIGRLAIFEVKMHEKVYQGMLYDDLAHGEGRILFQEGNLIRVAEGLFENGRLVGKKGHRARIHYNDDDVYEGYLYYGMYHGKGRFKSGFDAIFKYGYPYYGEGRFKDYHSGYIYEGSWFKGVGEGKVTTPQGEVYEGKWEVSYDRNLKKLEVKTVQGTQPQHKYLFQIPSSQFPCLRQLPPIHFLPSLSSPLPPPKKHL